MRRPRRPDVAAPTLVVSILNISMYLGMYIRSYVLVQVPAGGFRHEDYNWSMLLD